MSITNYATLQTAIAGWLKRDDLTSNIPDFIALYEAQMNRDLMNMTPPHLSLEATQSGTLAVTTTPPLLLAYPAGYKGTKRFQIQVSGDYYALEYKTPDQAGAYFASGKPRFYTTNGTNIEIAAPPDTTYAYRWDYYSALAPLSAGVNWLITNAPDLYLYGSLAHSAPFLKNDARLETWASIYTTLLRSVEMENTRNRQGMGRMQIRSDVAF